MPAVAVKFQVTRVHIMINVDLQTKGPLGVDHIDDRDSAIHG